MAGRWQEDGSKLVFLNLKNYNAETATATKVDSVLGVLGVQRLVGEQKFRFGHQTNKVEKMLWCLFAPRERARACVS